MMNASKNTGYTLIELMITVSIIGILAAIAFPVYENYIIKGDMAAARTALSNYNQELQKTIIRDGAVSQVTAATALSNVPRDGNFLNKFSLTSNIPSTGTVTAYTLLATPNSSATRAKDQVWMDQSGTAYACKPSVNVSVSTPAATVQSSCTQM